LLLDLTQVLDNFSY